MATNLKLNLFADDAYLCKSNISPIRLEETMNYELAQFYRWLNLNILSLNIDKTSYMIVTNRKETYNYEIKIGDEKLKQVRKVKYLGVTMDEKLIWKPHIKNVHAKVASGCWALRQLQQFVTRDVLLKVYYGLIYQNLQYCISCWGWVAKSNTKCLQVLQKRAIRTICSVHGKYHTSNLFAKLELLKFEDLYALQVGKIMHKIDNNSWLRNFNIQKINEIHSYNTRQSRSNYHSKQILNRVTRGAITASGPKIWRTIPEELKQLNFFNFKTKYKQFLIGKY